MRALIGGDGIALYRRIGVPPERHPWAEIAGGSVLNGVLMLHLRGDGGRLARCALRYSALETPLEVLQARLNAGLQNASEMQDR